MSEPYRNELEAALAQVAALRAENERLKAPQHAMRPEPTPRRRYRPVIWSVVVAGIPLVLLSTLIGKCVANEDVVAYCYPEKVFCNAPAGFCPELYWIKYHQPWHLNGRNWFDDGQGHAIKVSGKQAAIDYMKALGCPEVRP